MNNIMDILNIPFGYIMSFCYNLTSNYGVAIILFTFVMTLIMLPIQISQKKSMIKQYALRPKEEQIRKQYVNDKEKQNQLIMELYQKEGFNPMGGCLPLLIQFPIIIALYNVIRNPMSYVLHMSRDAINAIAEKVTELGYAVMQGNTVNQIELHNVLKDSSVLSQVGDAAAGFREISFQFFGLDLSATPSISQPSWLWIIPIMAGVTAFVSSWYSQKAMPAAGAAAGSTKTMLYIMPLISVFFCFSLSAGIGLYWSFNSLFLILKEFVLNKKFKPQEALKKAQEEAAISANQRKKAKKEALKAAAAKLQTDVEEDKKLIEKNTGKKGIALPEGKKVSYRFEDDPEIIEMIKAHNAAIDLANGVEEKDE